VTTRRLAIVGAFVGCVLTPWAVVAQAPFAQGSQMPDPKAMSGVPLPVPDLAVGTVTARVLRSALTNPLPGQTVELTGAGAAKTAKTDDAGRATFGGLPPGARVRAAVVVDGERIQSQEFDVPAAGGVRLMLVATDAGIEKKAAADRALAQGAAVSGTVVLGEQSRFVLEIADDTLNVFNLMQIVNTAKVPVKTAGPLVFELPDEAGGAGMMEGSTPSAVAAGKRVTVTGPFAPGNTVVQFAYSVPLGSEEIVLAQKLPAQMTQMAIVVQKVGGMQLSSPQITEKREMTTEGQTYIVGQGGAVRAGDTVTLTLSRLPHRSAWPKIVALALAGVIVAAGAWGATRGGGLTASQSARRGQLSARRDKLFSELAALDAQRRKGTIEAGAYASRREQLVTALEDLYAGLERETAA
jgi:hypothetical protein